MDPVASLSSPARLSVVVHLHDPGSLPDAELARLSAMPLERLASLLQRHPALRLGLYLPGRVLETAFQSAPRAVEALRQVTQADRLEWLGGGYHDPLFLLVPEASRRVQMQMLRQALRTHAGVEPRGVWLPEMVWDPSLVPTLVQSGFAYTVLKDWQVAPAAVPGVPEPGGWYLTEELGLPFRLLASQESLCALFRAGAVEEMLKLAVETGGNPRSPVGVLDIPLLAPTREGFEPVHLDRLEALAALCEAQGDAWRFLTPSELMRQVPALGTACVPPSANRAFCPPGPGGGVRDLLRRNPVANAFHKRLLHLSQRAEETPGPRARASAQDALMRAQNAAFYRDADEAGGLRFLRDRVRMGKLLLEAEAALDEGAPDDAVRVDALDLLCEGTQQILARHARLGILVEPRRGGRISELDHRSRLHPWGAVPASRTVLAEHFVPSPEGVEDPLRLAEFDVGDFQREAFESQLKRSGKDLQIVLSRTGTLSLEGEPQPLTLEKTFTLRPGKAQMAVTYKLGNPGTHLLLFGFSCAAFLSPAEPDPARQLHRLGSGQWTDLQQPLSGRDARGWEIADRRAGSALLWETAKPCRLEVRPLCASLPHGPDGRLEALALAASWEVRLAPGESWSLITRFQFSGARRS